MHELAVTQGIIDVAVQAAERNGGHGISAIDLVIGDLSSIVDDSIQFYFDILSQGTLAEGAVLRFRREPALAICFDCRHQFRAAAPLEPACPNCGSARLQVSGGREFFVESIEVRDEDSSAGADPQRQ